MKNFSLITNMMLFAVCTNFSVSAQEHPPRNEYTNSLMFEAPPVYEDQSYKNESEQHEQVCRDLQKQISALTNQPLRRSAAKERYQKECVGN